MIWFLFRSPLMEACMRLFRLAVFTALFSCLVYAKEVKIHGFVTAVKSPTNFEIDEYHINRDATIVLEMEKDETGAATATFRPEDIRVGTEVEIKGEYDEKTGELQAKSIKVYSDDTRTIKRTALIEKVPSLTKAENSWTGTFFADGQRVTVGPTTQVTRKPNKGEKKQAKDAKEAEPKEEGCRWLLWMKSTWTRSCTTRAFASPMAPFSPARCSSSTPKWKMANAKCGRVLIPK